MDRDTTILVIGAGGTGRSTRLAALAADDATWLTAGPHRAVDHARVLAAIESRPSQLVIDDVQWLDDASLDALIDAAPGLSLLISRRTWPLTPRVRALDDALAGRGATERLGPLDLESFAAAASTLRGGPTPSEFVDVLFELTGGSVGLLADALSAPWDGDPSTVPDQIIDAVQARVDRADPAAAALLSLLVMADDVPVSLIGEALPPDVDPDQAERAAQAGGLVDAEIRPYPLVGLAGRRALTARQRAAIHDQLAPVLAPRAPEAAIRHLLAGSGRVDHGVELLIEAAGRVAIDDPERCLELIDQAAEQGVETAGLTLVQALAAFRVGRHDALGFQRLPVDATAADREALAFVGFGTDVRDLRWEAAADRPLASDVGAVLAAFARACVGQQSDGSASSNGDDPQLGLVARLTDGLRAVLDGETAAGVSLLTTAADDYDRQNWTLPLGVTPHLLSAACSMWAGDVDAANGLLTQAADQNSGGPGEVTTHRLLGAYGRLLQGDYADALEVVNTGDETTWPLRDRLLVAAIDAAIARRSGDTTRLRDAWARSEAVLLRPTGTWLFLDPVLELLVAGARLGDERRVRPVADSLIAQLAALPAGGAGPASAHWLELQMALARSDDAAVRLSAVALQDIIDRALDGERVIEARVRARAAAAGVWSALTMERADEAAAMSAAALLIDVGDGWEASRILGQTALDHEDPKAARRLLEAARGASVDVSDAEAGDGLLALGLSEREAEVAQLVCDGKTYKEIGAQLYISPKTVEHHVANIRQKLGATSRAEMVAMVRQATEPGN